MPIRAGASNISAVLMGTTAISRAYRGSSMVFDGVDPGTPVVGIRGARSEVVNASSVNFALPSGSLAGDRLVLIVAHAWHPTVSAAFTLIAQAAEVNFGGGVLHRVLSAGDITTGYVTVPFAGSGRGVLHGVTVEGTSQVIRNVTPVWSSSGSNPETLTSTISLEASDLVLAGGGRRIDSDAVCDLGTEQSKAQGPSASGVINAAIMAEPGVAEASFTYSATQYSYHALVAMAVSPAWAVTSTRWRVFMPNTNQSGGTNHAFRRVEMRALPGGPTLCGQGTATSGTVIGSNTPDNAFDWNNTTLWASNGVGEQWLEYEFVEPVHVGELSLTIQTEDWSPTSVQVQYWDGDSWETYWTAAPGTWTGDQTKVMTMAPDVYRYWRVTDLGPPQYDDQAVGSVGLSELIFASTTGGPAIPVSSITASDTYLTRVPERLIDNDTSTYWTGAPASGATLTVDLGAPKPVGEVRMTSYPTSAGSRDGILWGIRQGPMRFRLQGSEDGSTWVDAMGSPTSPVTIPAWTAGAETKSFDLAPVVKAINLVGRSTAAYLDAVTSINQTIPAEAVAGDLLLAFVMHRDTLTPPAGWALVASESVSDTSYTHYGSVYKRTAQAGDAEMSTTWTQATPQRMAVQIEAYRKSGGCDVVASATTQELVGVTICGFAEATATENDQLGVAFATCLGAVPDMGMAPSEGWARTSPAMIAHNRLFVGHKPLNNGEATTGTVQSSVITGTIWAAVSLVIGPSG